jgi:endonuclease G
MKAQSMQQVVESTTQRVQPERIEELRSRVRSRKPSELVSRGRMILRRARLTEAEVPPSPVDFERILGENDMVDVNYLLRGLAAARSVCRVVLRDRFGREIGYGTGFKVAPRVIMTNHHVLEDAATAETAIVEFDYELDVSARPRATTRFALQPSALFLNDRALDFALAAIAPEPLHGGGALADYDFQRLNPEEGKINPGEFVTIIQHPSGQPKQIALRENELLSIEDTTLLYQSDTAQGSSGAPVFNDSWQIVALHHSGVPRKDAAGRWLLKNGQPAGPDSEDGDIDWIANEGIRASRIVRFVEANRGGQPLADEFLRAAAGELRPTGGALVDTAALASTLGGVAGRGLVGAQLALGVEPIAGGARVTVPISFTIAVDGMAAGAGVPAAHAVAAPAPRPQLDVAPPVAMEKTKAPILDPDYDNRTGYDPDFLGIEVPMPTVPSKSKVAKMEDGKHVIPYQHFSVIVEKNRRMALVTASNVDARASSKEPEPGRDYTRKGLGGFGPNDKELWVTDPRIPELQHLPDRFFTRDGGAFDRGHLVRREDVCFGGSYAEVRRANGDTYHTTNCSPQVADFNQSSKHGIWGELENFILEQADTETYCLFAGPLLQADDREFVGVDDRGEVRIQIPSAYWKIVVARAGGELLSFAFLLEQDLTGVPLEFAVTAEWAESMVAIADLEDWIGNLRFAKAIKDADQFGTVVADEMLRANELSGLRRGRRGLRAMEA